MDIVFYTVSSCMVCFILGMLCALPFVASRRARRAFERSISND